MLELTDEQGQKAVPGAARGYWLQADDFIAVSLDEKEGRSAALEEPDLPQEQTACTGLRLDALGFPRDWPAVYTRSAALKTLIGRRGRLPAVRVAVAGAPTEAQRARMPAPPLAAPAGAPNGPLQSLAGSFASAERTAEQAPRLAVVRGWAVFERLDRPAGAAFAAARYWWNALPDGTWVDPTPRPHGWPALLLVKPAPPEAPLEGPPSAPAAAREALKRRTVLTAQDVEFARRLSGAHGRSPQAPPQAPLQAPPQPSPQVADRGPGQPLPPAAPRSVPAPPRTAATTTPARKKGVDYSKFEHIEDSDDERLVPRGEAMTLPMGMPREAVSREEYDKVWHLLLENKDLPFTPPPDLDVMWGYYKYGGMDEQALLDQACEYLGKFPCRFDPVEYKAKTYTLTKKLETENRDDEARMWSIISICRFPSDPDAYYNQGVLLNKLCDRAKFGSAPTTRLPSLETATRSVPTEMYCSLFSRAAVSYYRRCLKVDPKQRPAYINLIGSLERNEPSGWYEDVQQLAAAAVKNGIWYNKWQRPPHFVPSLASAPWHDPQRFSMCRALEEHYPTIQKEYAAYVERLANRKDWDDTDRMPGPSDVGHRPGALHDGGLAKSGRWREVPLFANCALQREYAEYFPQTIHILQTHGLDATGLALCGGGDVIFSVLAPGTRLRPHCGPSNSRLTCHLGVRVPRTCAQGCRLRVGGEEPRGWEEGRCVVFDDSMEHEVIFDEANPHEPYPGDRVVLLANFWHPDFQFKNDPDWRTRSDEVMAAVDVETLPQTALMKTAEVPAPAARRP